jgi:kynureninase
VKIIRQKTVLLCAYLRYLLTPLVEGPSPRIRIITPEDPKSSGAQLSLLSLGGGVTDIMKKCNEKGLFFDERSPDLIRVAPIGLYNTFRDVHIAATILKEAILSLSSN